MKKIHVSLKQNAYKIIIGEEILKKLGAQCKSLNLGKNCIVITNRNIRKLYGRTLASSMKKAKISVKVFEVPNSEKSKSARIAIRLLEGIAKYDVLKNVFIIALGGGVIGDLAGYVAAAYKRGVPYVQVPTSFLAQIDSAIGGKVAIDLSVGKNLVGAFYQPKVVWSDVSVLKTLPKKQMKNGLAEAIKYGIIYDKQLFAYLEKNYDKVITCDSKVLNHVVSVCSRIKSNVVVADEKETKGIRTILNFGHTIGHAIEAAGKYSVYQHGEAIALGMRVATDISVQMKLLKASDARRINQLITHVGLPKKIQKMTISQILKLMKHDKKFISGKNRFVLAQNIGRVKVVDGVRMSVISHSINRYLGKR